MGSEVRDSETGTDVRLDAATPAVRGVDRTWNPARVYLWVSAVYLTVLSAAGFFYNRTFPVGAAAAERAGSGHILGIFETNGWHNLAGLVFGVVALVFLTRPVRDAALGAIVVGVPNLIAFIAFSVAAPTTFWFASDGADNIVHATLGFGGILAALLTREREGMIRRPDRERS
ncbi:MAG: DUF4383 domain-containing protein [Actinomycetota bacterium]